MAARLCLVEREEIRAGLERGWSLRRIATEIGRAASTVSREVAPAMGAGSATGRLGPNNVRFVTRLDLSQVG
jgi:hypothetical protein